MPISKFSIVKEIMPLSNFSIVKVLPNLDIETISAAIEIDKHWKNLKGAPGKAVSKIEKVGHPNNTSGEGYRIRYKYGAIYYKKGKQPAWVYGDINAYYESTNNANGWLGFPTSDEAPFAQEGRVSTFEFGNVYWWPDTGAIALNDVQVHYTGIVCYGEADWDQASTEDEPYVVLGVVSPSSNLTFRSIIYDDVDDGEVRTATNLPYPYQSFSIESMPWVEIFRGKPLGMNISTLMMEHDYGDPDIYYQAVEYGVRLAMEKLVDEIRQRDLFGKGEAIADVAEFILPEIVPLIAVEINKLLDTDDDVLGHETLQITAKQMIVLAARAIDSNARGILYKFESKMFTGGGAQYKVYFTVHPVDGPTNSAPVIVK